MALIDPCLYLQADAHPARSFRHFITEVFSEGILGSTSMAVSERNAGAGGPNFSVDIAAGRAVVQGDSATQQGSYLCTNDAVKNEVVTSAPSAGNERYDIVILEVKDNAEDAGGLNLPRFRVVAGTPAAVGTATAPAVPVTSLLLATIGPIVNGTTTITNSLIVDGRTPASLAREGSTVWQTLTGGSYSSGTIRYKRLGNIVFVNFRDVVGSDTTMGTLPVGFRPAAAVADALVTTSAGLRAVQIATSGAITINSIGGASGWFATMTFEGA